MTFQVFEKLESENVRLVHDLWNFFFVLTMWTLPNIVFFPKDEAIRLHLCFNSFHVSWFDLFL